MKKNKTTKLTDEDLLVLNKLEIMMKKKGLRKEDIERDCNFSTSKVKSYLTGQRRITEQSVRDISDYYHIDYNWFYGKTDFMDDIDMHVFNLSVLNKVFRMRIVPNRIVRGKDTYDMSSVALKFDQRYIDYISDIYELEREQANPNSVFSEDEYENKRKEIFSNHERYLRQIFEKDNFIEAKSLAVESADDISFVDMLMTVNNSNKNNY